MDLLMLTYRHRLYQYYSSILFPRHMIFELKFIENRKVHDIYIIYGHDLSILPDFLQYPSKDTG